MKPWNDLGHLCTLDPNNYKIICPWFHKTSKLYRCPWFIYRYMLYKKLICDIQNSNIKVGHHQIGGWHAEDILNKELKYFMRHIFSTHICYPLQLLQPSHKLREPIPSIHSFKMTKVTNKSLWRTKFIKKNSKFSQILIIHIWYCKLWKLWRL